MLQKQTASISGLGSMQYVKSFFPDFSKPKKQSCLEHCYPSLIFPITQLKGACGSTQKVTISARDCPQSAHSWVRLSICSWIFSFIILITAGKTLEVLPTENPFSSPSPGTQSHNLPCFPFLKSNPETGQLFLCGSQWPI